jgi:hypothetical protein
MVLKIEQKKELSFDIVFKRIALNPKTLQNVSGYFLQTISLKVLAEERYKDVTITQIGNSVFINHKNLCHELVLTPKSCETYGVEMTKTEPKRIKTETAIQLVKEKKAVFFGSEDLSKEGFERTIH